MLLSSFVPGAGSVLTTSPGVTELVSERVETSVNPSWCSSVVAAAAGLPTTSEGTVSVLVESHQPRARPRKNRPTARAISTPTTRATHHQRRDDSSGRAGPSPL